VDLYLPEDLQKKYVFSFGSSSLLNCLCGGGGGGKMCGALWCGYRQSVEICMMGCFESGAANSSEIETLRWSQRGGLSTILESEGRAHAWPRPCVQPGGRVDGGGRLHSGPPLRRLSRGPRRASRPGPFLKAFPSSGIERLLFPPPVWFYPLPHLDQSAKTKAE